MDLPAHELVFRLIPLLLLVGIAATAAIAVLNNVSSPRANLPFVEHILSMDTTYQLEGTRWRAIGSPRLQVAAFVVIVGAVGTYFLIANLTAVGADWEAAKSFGYAAFLVALIIWFFIFQVVGAEWFESWQSESWNGIRDSIRINLITIAGVILLRLS